MNFDGSRMAFTIGNHESNDVNLMHESRFMGTQAMVIVKDGQYFLKDCGQVMQMATKLDLKK